MLSEDDLPSLQPQPTFSGGQTGFLLERHHSSGPHWDSSVQNWLCIWGFRRLPKELWASSPSCEGLDIQAALTNHQLNRTHPDTAPHTTCKRATIYTENFNGLCRKILFSFLFCKGDSQVWTKQGRCRLNSSVSLHLSSTEQNLVLRKYLWLQLVLQKVTSLNILILEISGTVTAAARRGTHSLGGLLQVEVSYQ